MKKTWMLLAICTLSLALFTACTSNADTMPQNSPTVSNAPTTTATTAPTNSMNPMDDMIPSVTDGTGVMGSSTTNTMNNGGVNTVEDALRVSDQISEEVEKLSELTKAEAIVAGNIALVAVEYDGQYQGGMTDRLKDMITERVETIDKAVTSVHVSDSQEMVSLISGLREKLKTAQISFDELQTQILDAGSTIAGGGTPQVSQPQSDTQG
ncbi:MAG: YhcN/YlaJ family sporulation lipoprotein [Clostridia bacterium]|nr:YhcN/YlaJ family sporulation lipoprotein [Clostridia bacterium]